METRAVADLIVDARCQARVQMDGQALEEYAEAYRAGEALPPLEVFDVNGQLVIVDGFHRQEAARRTGVATLPVVVVGHGSIHDAMWYALGANKNHGLRRSRDDKRKAVWMAIEREDGRSDREIARHVGVSHTFVANLRRGEQLEMAQPLPNPEELRQEADVAFGDGDFARARILYEKAIAVSPEDARAELQTRVRLCEEGLAPFKRMKRIHRRTEHRLVHWEHCAICGLDGHVIIKLSWTCVAICSACISAMTRSPRASATDRRGAHRGGGGMSAEYTISRNREGRYCIAIGISEPLAYLLPQMRKCEVANSAQEGTLERR